MVDAARARKLADRIQQIVAEMLERRIKDPRLGFVTVTDTRITADLREATVFYTVFGSEAERADSAAALESAKGIIRSEVGKQTGVRFTPTLTFKHDPLPDSARQLDNLINAARAKDEELARQAENATYAGDADPYKKPDTDDADEDEPSDHAGHSTA
ncbi:30S ribosome-binding factor RbfA [Nonomuraea typhae]|uniref:30S ribosome-binding factor RbfA n=1 Tax=Nonomuraea typhae TaxID=2603600 RepID=UPI0012F7A589|nr:30S ribosome-binding factor RbfA [Nonomuraea typhae]